jgi:hypothetical protein
MTPYHRELLESALEGREREVTEYEVNIRNFRAALRKVGDDPSMAAFKAHLESLLSSSILEQRKAQIMLEVVREQLEGHA